MSMAEVYGSSWCNLAATDNRDGWEGLFSGRELRPSRPFALKFSGTKCIGKCSVDDEFGQTFLGQLDRELLCFDTDTWKYITSSPLNTRGWVCQESYLSRQTLHFANDQIYWEYQQLRTPEGFPKVELAFHGHVSSAPRKILSSTSHPASTAEYTRAVWTAYLECCSAGKLNIAEDKQPAILGLARRL